MRKRILIGVLAIFGVGILVFVLSQPKEGTVEWHKGEYLRLSQQTLVDKAKQFFRQITGRVTGRKPTWRWTQDDYERLQTHRAALLELGYLSQQQFDLTNNSLRGIGFSPAFRSACKRSHREFLIISGGKDMLHVIAVTEEMPLFVEAFRKAEAPENVR